MQGIVNDSVSNLSITSINETEIENATPKSARPSKDVSAWKLIRLNGPEWGSLLIGFFGCAVFGSVMPIFAYFYGEVFAVSAKTQKRSNFYRMNIFQTFTLTGDALKTAAEFWTSMFLVLAVGSAVSSWLQVLRQNPW